MHGDTDHLGVNDRKDGPVSPVSPRRIRFDSVVTIHPLTNELSTGFDHSQTTAALSPTKDDLKIQQAKQNLARISHAFTLPFDDSESPGPSSSPSSTPKSTNGPEVIVRRPQVVAVDGSPPSKPLCNAATKAPDSGGHEPPTATGGQPSPPATPSPSRKCAMGPHRWDLLRLAVVPGDEAPPVRPPSPVNRHASPELTPSAPSPEAQKGTAEPTAPRASPAAPGRASPEAHHPSTPQPSASSRPHGSTTSTTPAKSSSSVPASSPTSLSPPSATHPKKARSPRAPSPSASSRSGASRALQLNQSPGPAQDKPSHSTLDSSPPPNAPSTLPASPPARPPPPPQEGTLHVPAPGEPSCTPPRNLRDAQKGSFKRAKSPATPRAFRSPTAPKSPSPTCVSPTSPSPRKPVEERPRGGARGDKGGGTGDGDSASVTRPATSPIPLSPPAPRSNTPSRRAKSPSACQRQSSFRAAGLPRPSGPLLPVPTTSPVRGSSFRRGLSDERTSPLRRCSSLSASTTPSSARAVSPVRAPERLFFHSNPAVGVEPRPLPGRKSSFTSTAPHHAARDLTPRRAGGLTVDSARLRPASDGVRPRSSTPGRAPRRPRTNL